MSEPREPTPFERLRAFTRRLVAVPKAEIDKQARAYRKRRKRSDSARRRGN